jgi:hypothetical protein
MLSLSITSLCRQRRFNVLSKCALQMKMEALRHPYAIININILLYAFFFLFIFFSICLFYRFLSLSSCLGQSLVLIFHGPGTIGHCLLRGTGGQLFVEYSPIRVWNTVGIVSRSTASVGNVETLVEPRQGVREDDDDLDEIDEAVEAGL